MGNTWLSKLEEQQRELTKIKNLKIKYVRVFGYCIEIPKGQISSVPSNYIRKQTLSNYERYTIPELIDIERKILEADDKIKILEYDIFCNIRGRFFEHMDAMQVNAQIIAEIDMLQSLATVAVKNKYCKPTINEKGYIDIKSGRHPVVEVMNKGDFIANDAYLDQEDDILSIISGPNMAGKSTFMRQIALIVLMAQMGSFIPAFSADICIVDRIFTRIGASDNLATGESTFMIEMMEVVNILNNATKDSLIIMDEVGRGTSTYDGLSIARAVIEYIVDKSVLGAKTLFSTHYLELNNLSKKVPGIKNYHVTVEPQSDEIIFLRKIIPGGSDNSYGIYVAKMAGMPVSILKRSEDMLSGLLKIAKFMDVIQEDEDDLYYGTKKGKSDPNKYRIIVNELMAKDLSDLDLPEALKWIAILKKQLLDTLIASK
jgi:DNA mismatch repair protein MutS